MKSRWRRARHRPVTGGGLAEARLRALLHVGRHALWTCDRAGTVLSAEGPGLAAPEWRAEALAHRRFAALWSDASAIERCLATCLGGEPCTVTADRSGRRWELRAEPLVAPTAAGPRILGAIVAGADVTDRKQSLDAIRQNEARLRLLTESLPAIVWSVDRDLHVSSVGGAGLASLGLGGDGREGGTLYEALGTKDEAFLPIAAHQRALAGEQASYGFEWRGRSYRVRLEPLVEETGLVSGAVGLAFDITEQKRAEQEARNPRAEIEAVLESVRDPIWWIDPDGRLVMANSSFAETSRTTFGRPLRAGESPVELLRGIDDDLAEHWSRLYARALAGEVIHERQEQQLRGHPKRWLWVSLYPVHIDGGRLGVCCCTKDITELETARRDLRHSEERYTQLFDTCPLPVIVTRREDGMLLAANRAAETFYGFRREEAVGQTTRTLGFWADPRDRDRMVAELDAHGSVSGFETRYRAAGGEVRDVVLSCTTAIVDGTPCIIGLSDDVTDRKRFVLELEQSEERYHTLFEACPLPIFLTRVRDGRVIAINRSAEAGSGWRRDEVLGRTALELGWWGEEADRERMLGQLSKGPVRDFPGRVRVRDGGTRDVLLSAASVRLEGEACLMTLVEDVTERKRLEDQLRQAAKMEAVGRLAGGIAHDFNNLLTVMLGQAHLLRDRLGPEHPQQPLVTRMEESVERAARLTAQLLTFGRKQVLQPQPHDVSAIVRECSSMIERIIGDDVELATHLAPEPAWSVIDRGQLEQVVINLAVNARDAMSHGGRILIRTDVVDVPAGGSGPRAPAPGSYVLIAVTDTGSGMDESTKSRVFEPFFTTKPQGKGTGLGLAMVYGLVRQSGGHVLVESTPGRGSTFRIFLPRGSPPARAGPVARPERARGAGRFASVLLVEDEDDVRMMLEEMLRDRGHRVLSARNGEEALTLARCERDRIDVLVSDLMMPRMNGAELAHRIRAERPDLRVVFISGYAGDAAEQLPALDRRTAFLQKPFPEEALESRLRELFEEASPA